MWDRFKSAFQSMLDHMLGSQLDYLARYPSTVVAQDADGSLQLKPDDARLPGLTGIPIWPGLPGVSMTVPVGARVLLAFAAGDPAMPIAEMWGSGTPLTLVFDASTSIKFGDNALQGVARLGDTAGPYVITSASAKVLSE